MSRNFLAALALAMAATLYGCVGWGDMFAEKRTVVGSYFIMTGEGEEANSYYLFRRGDSGGSIAGPLRAIGWDQNFILAGDDRPGDWAVFAVDASRNPVPTDAGERGKLIVRLRKTVTLRSPNEVWAASRSSGSRSPLAF